MKIFDVRNEILILLKTRSNNILVQNHPPTGNLTLSVMGYLTVIFSWGGVLKTHSLKTDLTLFDHYDNHTM